MLGFMSQDRVLGPLAQEMDHVNQYLELERTRLAESIQFQWNIASDVLPAVIPCPLFILQPLVENAIWHGLSGTGVSEPSLAINVHWNDQDLVIAVCDNGTGIRPKADPKSSHKSRGTAIVKERLALLRHRGQLEILDCPDGHPFERGVMARMTLPLWALEPYLARKRRAQGELKCPARNRLVAEASTGAGFKHQATSHGNHRGIVRAIRHGWDEHLPSSCLLFGLQPGAQTPVRGNTSSDGNTQDTGLLHGGLDLFHEDVENGTLNARSNVILTGFDKRGITLYVLLQELPDLGFQPTEAHIQTGHFRFGKCEGRAIAFSGHAIQHRPSRVR